MDSNPPSKPPQKKTPPLQPGTYVLHKGRRGYIITSEIESKDNKKHWVKFDTYLLIPEEDLKIDSSQTSL